MEEDMFASADVDGYRQVPFPAQVYEQQAEGEWIGLAEPAELQSLYFVFDAIDQRPNEGRYGTHLPCSRCQRRRPQLRFRLRRRGRRGPRPPGVRRRNHDGG